MKILFRNIFAVILAAVFLSGCGSGGGSSSSSGSDTGTGSIAFSVEWQQSSLSKSVSYLATSSDVCVDYGIATVNGYVLDSSNSQIASQGWQCSAHSGTISNVAVGSGYTVRLEGLDSGGTVTWRGEVSGVSVSDGQTASAGTIAMSYVGGDTTPPTVSSVTPSATTNVPVTTAITATFSENMASSTINTTNFTLTQGTTSVTGSVSYDSSTKIASFTPSGNLSYSTPYTATITTAVTDMAGNAMASVSPWSFTTGSAGGTAPSAPTGVSATAGDSQVQITWTGSTGATSYNIYWSNTTGVTKTTGTKIIGAASPYTHIGLTNGTTYYYVVTAVNSYGESGVSSQVSGTPAIPTATTLASGLSFSSHIVIDSTSIYWAEDDGTVPYYTDATTGMIKKVGINGGTVTTLASGLNHPDAVMVDASNIYFIEKGSWPNNNGNIKKVPTGGGAITTLASGQNYPQGSSALDSTSFYWIDSASSPTTIKKVGINGGSVTTIVSGAGSSWGPGPMVADSTNVYWIHGNDGNIKKVSVNGGTVTTLVSGLSTVNTYPQIAVDSTNLYWTEPSGGTVKKVSINGGTVTTLASGLSNPSGIAVDSTNVYWTDSNSSGAVKKVSINGGTVTTLASGLNDPTYIAIDVTNLYWTEPSGGTVKKIAK